MRGGLQFPQQPINNIQQQQQQQIQQQQQQNMPPFNRPQLNMQPHVNNNIQIPQQQSQFRPRQMIGGPLSQQLPLLPQKKAIVDPLDQNIGTFGNVGFFQPKPETNSNSIFNVSPPLNTNNNNNNNNSTATPTQTTPQPRKRRFQEGDEIDQKAAPSKIALEKKKALDRRLMPPPPVAVVLVTRAKRKLEEQKSQDVESIGSFKLVSYT